MIDNLVENILENTTFKSPSGNAKLELNAVGEESMNVLKEVLLAMSEHHRWEEEHKVRIITNKQFTDFHMGKWSSEEGYNYYSTDGDFLFHG